MCWTCNHIYPRIPAKAFAIWFYNQTGFAEKLCKKCLDQWLDNADDDEALEPSNVVFL